MRKMVRRVSETDAVREIAALPEEVRQGSEVIVERNHRPIAVIKPSKSAGRPITEVIAAMEASSAHAVIDEDFARDVEEGVNLRRQPWNPPSGD